MKAARAGRLPCRRSSDPNSTIFSISSPACPAGLELVGQDVLLALDHRRIDAGRHRPPADWRRRHASRPAAEAGELVGLAGRIRARPARRSCRGRRRPVVHVAARPRPAHRQRGGAAQRHVLADRGDRCRRSRRRPSCEPAFAALIASTSAPTSSATSAIILTRPWKWSLRATKSVSELTSTTTPLLPATDDADQAFGGDAAGLLGGLGEALLAQPVDRASMSPLVSVSAALQSIMPAPVFSRSSFTIAAVIVAICIPFQCGAASSNCARRPSRHRYSAVNSFALRDPALDAAGQADLLADVVRGRRR